MAINEKTKQTIDAAVTTTKDALTKAGGALHEFGNKSVLRIEITQLASKQKKEFEAIGREVYQIFVEDEKASVPKAKVAAHLDEITRINDEIAKRKVAL
ncbi:MAG: hypothetical protein Ta2A_21310 [Treponemataceae bacterium]|nr:MAG: hypothetical protein Ta2A_21310 [Treponemataceae bacterium]